MSFFHSECKAFIYQMSKILHSIFLLFPLFIFLSTLNYKLKYRYFFCTSNILFFTSETDMSITELELLKKQVEEQKLQAKVFQE